MSSNKLLEGKSAVVRCAPGDVVLYPLALVCLDLPMAVLLGVDVPELPLLFHRSTPNVMVEYSEAFMTTQAGTRRKAKEDTHDSRKMYFSGVRSTHTLAEQSWELGTELDDVTFQGGNQRPTQTGSQE